MLATRRRRVLLFVALGVAAFAVYVPRTFRAMTVMGDSAELVTAAATWGVPHAPGYPLYTTMAHLIARLPVFELPFRVHASSALFHAVTVAVVGAIIERMTASFLAAFIGAATLAFGRIFFMGSLYAEVFPLNDLLFASLLWFAIGIHGAESSEKRGDPHSADARLYLGATVLGLSLAHHQMIALAFPSLILLVATPLGRDLRRRPRAMFGALVCALGPPLLFYALVPVAASRHPLPSWGDVHDVSSLWRLVTRADYGGLTHASRRLVDGQLLERLDAWFAGTADSFGVVGVLLFFAGALWAIRRERRTLAALCVAIFCTGPLFAALNAFDIHSSYRVAFFERFATMSHVPASVMVGFGAAQLRRWLDSFPRISPQRTRGAMGLVAVLAVAPLVGNVRSVDFHDDRRGAAFAHDLIDGVPDGALVLLKSDMASQAALYACGVERRCGDRVVLAPGQLWMPWKRTELARRYPDLSLPPEGTASAAAWLVEHSLPARPVFIHPELVDDVVHGNLSILPSLLLFRVYSDERALRADLPQFRAELSDLAEARRCEGCRIVEASTPINAADEQLRRIYDTALRAHAGAANELEWTAEAAAISRLYERK